MRSEGWNEALLAKHRAHLRSAAAQTAFDRMVAIAESLRDYKCEPAWRGEIRDFRIIDRESGERPFSFITNRDDLLFYMRSTGRGRVPGGWPALKNAFASARENPSGEWTVRIANASDAEALSRMLFGSDAVEDILFGRLERERDDDYVEQQIRRRTDIGPTEKGTLIRARRGQGVFRSNLERVEPGCRLTGLLDRRHLRASHIKPWCQCDDTEKLDGFNGLLLSPHIDHLFDRGYISFSDQGDVIVSKHLNPLVLESWGIRLPRNVGAFCPEQHRYLEYHRTQVFEKTSGGRRKSEGLALELLETGEPAVVRAAE